jgi:hypothetical protein
MSRRLRWTGNAAGTGPVEVHTEFWWGNLSEGDYFEDPGIKSEDKIKMDLRDVGWGHGLDRSGSEQGQMASCCKCGNEPSGLIKCGEYLK